MVACVQAVLLPATPVAPQAAPSSTADLDQIGNGRDLPVKELVLGNGMRFLLLDRPGAPTVSFVVHVPVGSIHEPPGQTGISHFLEHLLFKGTTTIGTTDLEAERIHFAAADAVHDSIVRTRAEPSPEPGLVERLEERLQALEDSARAYVIPNEYDRILSANGARGPNATTSYEATTYYVSLPSNRAQLWFVLESDRMRSSVLREFFTERRVVMEERRLRTEASPAGLLSVAHHSAAFTEHPYGVPPIGYREDLLGLSRRQVEAYYPAVLRAGADDGRDRGPLRGGLRRRLGRALLRPSRAPRFRSAYAAIGSRAAGAEADRDPLRRRAGDPDRVEGALRTRGGGGDAEGPCKPARRIEGCAPLPAARA